MQQSGIVMVLVVLVAGIFASAFIAMYVRRRAEGEGPTLPLITRAIFKSNDPSTRSPAGSMAARREDIEDLLRGKEDQPG
jgi:hypothetical protein